MNSLERTLTTINGNIPDRIPTDLHNFLPATRMAGYDTIEGLQNGEIIAESHLKAREKFGHDVLLVENGTCAEAEALGCEVRYFEDGPPRVTGNLLEDFADWEDLSVPDPTTTFPLNELLKATEIITDEIGNEAFVMGRGDQGPFALAAALIGYEDMIKRAAIAVNRNDEAALEEIKGLVKFCKEVNDTFARAQIDAGAHATSFGEFGADILGPNIYKSLIFQFDRDLISGLEDDGITVSLHICGDNTAIIEEMIETGATILEVDHKPDLERVREKTEDEATLLGPVDTELIAHAPVNRVEEATKEAVEALAPGGRFIAGPGCALGYETTEENIAALIDTAKEFGKYS